MPPKPRQVSVREDVANVARSSDPNFPPYFYEAYRSTVRRSPRQPLIVVPHTLSEITGPGPAVSSADGEDNDLTQNLGAEGEAMGERIIVTGRVLDDDGNPVPNTLVEIWQANAAGRYRHQIDQHHAHWIQTSLGSGIAARMSRVHIASRPSSRARIRGKIIRTRGGPPTSIFRCLVRPGPAAL